jgi:ABC-type Fe3+/spermidine/putrescine transport system ATPase subunit
MTKAYLKFARDCPNPVAIFGTMSLELDKISKRYGDRWILRDFSLTVNRGEIFGLLGAAASGKTAVLKIIAGKENADSGNIAFAGKTIANAEFLGETAPKFSWKNLFGGGNNSRISETERRRAEFEKILNSAASVLLLDNPFACLDKSARDAALQNLRQTATEKNLAVVFATHDFEEAFEICDRVGVLYDGEIAQSGTARELYEHPASVAVASILGRNNLIAARRVSFNNQPIPEFQTLTGEHRLQTGKAEKKELGAITNNVTLMIRPEHISISFGASFPEDNLLKARIAAVQYRGATTRVKLNADGLILEALVLRLVGLNEGDECMVGLPPDRILVLKN